MSRVCTSTETLDGDECGQVVADESDHCRAGHHCAPVVQPERVDLEAFPIVEDSTGVGGIDDLLSAHASTPAPHRQAPPLDIPKWRVRSAAQGLVAAAAAIGGAFFAGVALPIPLVVLGVLGFASQIMAGWSNHKDDKARAKEAQETTEELARLAIYREGIASDARHLFAQLSELISAPPGDRDEARGTINAYACYTISHHMPAGSRVAYYRSRNRKLVPTELRFNWSEPPTPIDLDGRALQYLEELMKSQRTSKRIAGSGDSRHEQIVLPVHQGQTLYGLIVVDAPPGVQLDWADVDLCATCAEAMASASAIDHPPIGRGRGRSHHLSDTASPYTDR